MENDDMENEEKKQGKHIYAIRLSLTCHFFNLLSPPNPKKQTNLELDDSQIQEESRCSQQEGN